MCTWNGEQPWARWQGCQNIVLLREQSGFFHIIGKALERVLMQDFQAWREKTSWEETDGDCHYRRSSFFEPLPHQILNIRDLILSSHNTPKALSSLFPFQRWENSGWAAMMGWSNLEWGSNLPKSHRKIWVLKLTLVFLYPVTLAKLLWSPGQAAPCFKPERTMPRAS